MFQGGKLWNTLATDLKNECSIFLKNYLFTDFRTFNIKPFYLCIN